MNENADESRAAKPGNLSRRTVVRGAAAVAWTVPAVTLMTAAPAAAASTELHVTATGGYASSGANPTVVNFNLAVVVTGAQPANNLTMTLSVSPAAPHSTAPVFTAPAGWTLSGFATQPGGTGTAWVQTFVRTSQALGTENVSGTITFTDLASTPFDRWRGNGFTLGGTINASNQISAIFVPGSIAAATGSTLGATSAAGPGAGPYYVERWLGTYWSDIGDHRRWYAANPVLSGNTSITKITAVVTMTVNASGRWNLAPRIATLHSDWQQVGSMTVSGGVRTWTFETIAAAYAPTTNGGPGPIGPTSYLPFTTATQPWTAANPARFSVLFWPNASATWDLFDLLGSQNAFTGTLTFTTTSVGVTRSAGAFSRTLTAGT